MEHADVKVDYNAAKPDVQSSNTGDFLESDQDDDNHDFYFESDHLALRGNADYRSVLRTIVMLEAQRIEAAKHIDIIAAAEKVALNNPELFVQNLATGVKLDVPGPLNIIGLPKIKFEKYNITIPNDDEEEALGSKLEANDLTVRGRVFDQTKPETFNQLWTCEEQRRLEELLIEFPPEPIEMRRFGKIARALGNRTTKQVASRLQKYFQKLHAAGLPVPGRIPRGPRSYQSTRKNRINKQLIRPTTFFPSNYVPVNITDEDDGNVNFLDPNFYRRGYGVADETGGNPFNDNDGSELVETMVVDEQSDSELNPGDTERDKILRLVKRVKRDKEKSYKIEVSNCDHVGYTCDYCKENPITGTRWHCTTCIEESIDFCSDCLVTQLMVERRHSLDHKFIGLRVSAEFRSQSDDEDENDPDFEGEPNKEFFNSDDQGANNPYDKDYMTDKFSKSKSSYNYLDTNFLPE